MSLFELVSQFGWMKQRWTQMGRRGYNGQSLNNQCGSWLICHFKKVRSFKTSIQHCIIGRNACYEASLGRKANEIDGWVHGKARWNQSTDKWMNEMIVWCGFGTKVKRQQCQNPNIKPMKNESSKQSKKGMKIYIWKRLHQRKRKKEREREWKHRGDTNERTIWWQ